VAKPAAEEESPNLTLTPIEFAGNIELPATGPQFASARANAPQSDTISLEAALAELSREVDKVRDDLGAIDERVRACSAAPTVDVVEECVADLKQTGQRLYIQQTQAISAAPEACVDSQIEQQAEQLRQSLAELDTWRVDPQNLDADCRRLLDATEHMMQSCDEVEHALESAAANLPGNKTDVKNFDVNSYQPIHGVARVGRG
jgi:hypothetical protein